MIRSMTGFGAGSATTSLGEIVVEVKSLNNRFLDLNIKYPRELAAAEMQLREEVKRHLKRGKVDLYIRWTAAPDSQPLYEINKPLLQHYAREVTEAIRASGNATATVDINALLSLPGVVTQSAAATENDTLLNTAVQALRQALDALQQAREREGSQLADAIREHLKIITQLRTEIATAKDALMEEYRKRLKERIEVLARSNDLTVDPARMDTEILFYADKSDITEELVRLDAHLKTFNATLAGSASSEPIGKSLDFLVQELLREANTIGNKARGVDVAQLIVRMKSEIEKIREQVQNLE